MSVREYAMNTTRMAAEWQAEAARVAESLPETLPVDAIPRGRCLVQPYAGDRGGIYSAEYGYRAVEGGYEPFLQRVTCNIPPITPQADAMKMGDRARLPMMDKWGVSAHLEAEQRRKEWAEIAKQESA